MRSNSGANDIVCGFELHDPGTERLVDSITEGTRSCFNGDDFGAEKPNSEDIEGLSPNILLRGC